MEDQDEESFFMAKVVNIKWEKDGCDITLPDVFEIPEWCVDAAGEIDKEMVSDWLSDETGWLHGGFEITE